MKHFLIAVLIASIVQFELRSAFAASEEDDRVGQYFCIVEYAVGIMDTSNGTTIAGKIDLPDKDKKFFVRIKRIEHEQVVKDICIATANNFVKAFGEGSEPPYEASRFYGTRSFNQVCLAKYLAEIPMGSSHSNEAWSYRGLTAYHFRGVGQDWLDLYGNDTFIRAFTYDGGPTLQKGNCERIQAR